jgi:hypothetical protein
MDKVSLTALGRQHLAAAHDAHSGRSAHTVYGGHQHALRQTLIALTAGSRLDDHESPGEATLITIIRSNRLILLIHHHHPWEDNCALRRF